MLDRHMGPNVVVIAKEYLYGESMDTWFPGNAWRRKRISRTRIDGIRHVELDGNLTWQEVCLFGNGDVVQC